MTKLDDFAGINLELNKGISLEKCKKCGCMMNAFEMLLSSLPKIKHDEASNLLKHTQDLVSEMGTTEYSCLGCENCHGANITNLLNQMSPEVKILESNFEASEAWPPIPGEYLIPNNNEESHIAVSTLASVELAENIARMKPKGLCIVGKTETENIGIEKIIKNVISNPAIHYLIVAGLDAKGHYSGNTLLSLWENGVDSNMRVIGSLGKKPILPNVTMKDIETFRKQVKIINMIGCEEVDKIIGQIKKLNSTYSSGCGCKTCCSSKTKVKDISDTPIIHAKEPSKVELDKAGYFVIIPQKDINEIRVEHYSYDNQLLRVINGEDARTIYWTIIENGWLTQLSHAAYLGKELAKAELSIKLGFKYIQEGA